MGERYLPAEKEKKLVAIATGILRDNEARILLLKRSTNHKTFHGFWQLPEGKVEFGENPQDALKREIREELGFEVESPQLLGIGSICRLVGDTKYHLVRIVFSTKISGQLKLSDEHVDFRWVTPQKAIRLRLVPGTAEVLKTLI